MLAEAVDPVGVLVRLFTLGDPVPAVAAGAALPTLGVDRAVGLGLLQRCGSGQVRACVDLQPHAVVDDLGESSWWVCSDLGELAHGGGVLPTEHVLGVGTASTTLVEAVVPPVAGQRCLDVGAGSGVQSLHLSRTGPRLVATDVSGRASAFARVTAALNGVALDVRTGSLFDAVPGERFDRVVANLPFVVTPRRADVPTYTYRDAGLAGDDVVHRMLVSAPAHLRSGGLAQFLGNWEDRADEPWTDRVGGWVEEAAAALAEATDGADVLDVWVVQRELADPALYAEAWISDGGRPGREEAESWYRAWLDDFADRGVEAVGFGIVTLRRRPADPATPPLRRLDDERAVIPGAWRDVLAAGLTGHDSLGRVGALTDLDALLDTRPVLAAGVVERRELDPGQPDPRTVHLVDTRRRGRVVEASTALAGLVGACDGELSVGQVVAALATLLEDDEAALRARLLPAVRDLVAEGLLVLPGQG
ncbi:methyltransferase [Jannaschia sp. R86511]|uniref:methyltransferase n=1 Tax=Jannaschia sp. R86511 TaxID=3093853 RepID=UPI0036D427FD